MKYALLHFISWPLLIWLAYLWIRWAVRRFERTIEGGEA